MVKRILMLLTLSMISYSSQAQLSKRMAQDTLIWKSDSMLTREDFKAKRGGSAYGVTASFIYLYQKEKSGNMLFTVEAIFLKSKSFLKDESPYIIKHEQLHFDISELYARKLRKAISDKDFKKVKKTVEVIQQLYNRASADCNKEQDKYDNDTEHSINAAKQQVWNESIAKQLAELSDYASTEVNIVK
jgi:hypothetical protein